LTKALIKQGLDGDESLACAAYVPKEEALNKQYDREKVLDVLTSTLAILREDPTNEKYRNIHEIRRQLETILFKRSIDHMDSWEEYHRVLSQIDEDCATRISEALDDQRLPE
jgi:predicted Abi (CAAX) family protease